MDNNTLNFISENSGTRIYSIEQTPGGIETYIATAPETRDICNNPHTFGTEYTNLLHKVCTNIFRCFEGFTTEDDAVVVNILRGGLNFGLREALTDAYGWNKHTTAFMSAQRARDDGNPENWHITENSYRKLYFPKSATFIIGDVVATGTSLRYGLQELIAAASEQNIDVRNIFFFTYGGPKAHEILSELDAECRTLFPSYQRTILIYLEGCFTCPELNTPLTIRLTGTDLVKWHSLMAPEFIESQYESPAYPIERCIIYDAGSRAFWVKEYLEDVIGYWKQVLELAKQGMTFRELVKERCPFLDVERFGDIDLRTLAHNQIDALSKE